MMALVFIVIEVSRETDIVEKNGAKRLTIILYHVKSQLGLHSMYVLVQCTMPTGMYFKGFKWLFSADENLK